MYVVWAFIVILLFLHFDLSEIIAFAHTTYISCPLQKHAHYPCFTLHNKTRCLTAARIPPGPGRAAHHVLHPAPRRVHHPHRLRVQLASLPQPREGLDQWEVSRVTWRALRQSQLTWNSLMWVWRLSWDMRAAERELGWDPGSSM